MAEDHPDINDTTSFVLYRYIPSLPAAIIFVVLFALTTFYHIFQIGRKRTWYFIPLAVGGICTTPIFCFQ
jgi:ABC-type microcin C transport system permease subunit YejB